MGNPIASDDSVGFKVAERLQEKLSSGGERDPLG
jgi:Ni,Fe-hydrogenase maturation factor